MPSTNLPFYERVYRSLLSEKTRETAERTIVLIAIFSFAVHLLLLAAVHLGWIPDGGFAKLTGDPIVAVYTPFSFILIYEVYLLVYYLPKSITRYIGKQYEIITLIVIRKIFGDISHLEFTADWFNVEGDIQFTYDIIASVLLFFLIYLFYYLNSKRAEIRYAEGPSGKKIGNFVKVKKILAGILVPLFFILAAYNFGSWAQSIFSDGLSAAEASDVNNIFFEDFFTVLILADVFLLLFSFLHTDKFHQTIRNSGFVISTVLIKMSFGEEGLTGTILTVVAVIIGVLMLFIHNRFEKLEQKVANKSDEN